MGEERLTPATTIDRVKSDWRNSLPDFVQTLPPLPKKLLPDNQPIRTLLRPGTWTSEMPLRKYLDGLNISQENSDYVFLTVCYLAHPRINGHFPNHEVTIKSGRMFARKGLLEILDYFRDDPVRREVARHLLGLGGK